MGFNLSKWSPDPGLLFTTSVDALACGFLIILFLIVRNLRGDSQRTPERADIFGRLRRTSEEFMSASVSITHVANRLIRNSPQDHSIFGVGGQNYLNFLWHLGVLFTGLSIVGMLFVWPMEVGLFNVSSNDPFKNIRERIHNGTLLQAVNLPVSAKKLKEGSTDMWILWGIAWGYSLAAIWTVNHLVTVMQKPIKTEVDQAGLPAVSQMFTILVEKIPPCVNDIFNAPRLKEVLFRHFGEIIAVHIVPKMHKLYDLYSQKDRVTDRLTHLRDLEMRQFEGEFVNGEWRANSKKKQLPAALRWHVAPRRWWFPPVVGGLDYLIRAYEEERASLDKEITIEEAKEIESSNCAFITFCTVASVLAADGTKYMRYEDEWRATATDNFFKRCGLSCYVHPRNLVLGSAPLADDINWENIAVSSSMRWLRSIVAVGIVTILMVVVVTPVSMAHVVPIFLDIQSDFRTLLEKQASHLPPGDVSNLLTKINGSYDRVYCAFFTQYFSTVSLIFINSCILPIMIEQVANFQCMWRKEFKEQSTMFLNYCFMLLNLLIIPLLRLDSIEALLFYTLERVQLGVGKTLVMQLEELAKILGFVLVSTSATYAMKYFISSIFISSASQLLQAPQAFLAWWNSCRSVTTKEKEAAAARWPFDWGYWYGYNCAFFAVAMTFAPSIPTICPLAALHFFIKYYVDRYTLVYGVFEPMFQAEGHVEQLVIRCLYSGIAFMQLVMFGFFAIQSVNDPYFLYASWIFMVLLCFVIFLAITKTDVKRDVTAFEGMDYKSLYEKYRTPSLDIEELHFREQLPTAYRHPAVKRNPRLRSWALWQWPPTTQEKSPRKQSKQKPPVPTAGVPLRSILEEDVNERDKYFKLDSTESLLSKGPPNGLDSPAVLPSKDEAPEIHAARVANGFANDNNCSRELGQNGEREPLLDQ